MKSCILLYEREQIPEVLAYVRARPGTTVALGNAWLAEDLERLEVPYVSLEGVLDEKGAEEWMMLGHSISRGWYRLSGMGFFEYEGIALGEALEPMVDLYLQRLFYWVRAIKCLVHEHSFEAVVVPHSHVSAGPRSGPLAPFEVRVVADAARMAAPGAVCVGTEPAFPRGHASTNRPLKDLLLKVYNVGISLAPRRKMVVLAAEQWRNIGSAVAKLDAELVMLESAEFRHIPKRLLWKHRIRFVSPSGSVSRTVARRVHQAAVSFEAAWKAGGVEVGKFLEGQKIAVDWEPLLQGPLRYLVSGYAVRVMNDIESLRAILAHERPDRVLQRVSLSGRQHHFFLLARLSKRAGIRSVELQHAGAFIDPRSSYSRLETSQLAAYGPYVREWYAKNGYAPERIIPIGSPRFDRYALMGEELKEKGRAILRALGLDTGRPVLLVAVPPEETQIDFFDSWELRDFFRQVHLAQGRLGGVQVLFKFRPRHATPERRAFLGKLFPADFAIADREDLSALLSACDAVVTGNSTVIYEALLAHQPLVLYPWKRADTHHAAMYASAAPLPQSSEEFIATLERVFGTREYRDGLVAQGQRFLQGYLFDGKSSGRLADLLREHGRTTYCSVVDLTKPLSPNKEVRYEVRAALKDGLVVREVPFADFKRLYTSVVSVAKPEEKWKELAALHFAFIAYKDDIPVSGAAFMSHEKQAYYSMAATDFSSRYAAHAGYLLQHEVMKALKGRGFELYVVGLLADENDPPKLKDISRFKEKLGALYRVEGERFPFDSYIPMEREDQ